MIKIKNNVIKKVPNFWNNFHFHPTDAIEDKWGQDILNEAAKDGIAKDVRMYSMLEDIVSQDEYGNFKYDYELNDFRIEYLLSRGFNIFLTINFIPPCIAENSNIQSNVCKKATRYKGKMICTSKPRDYKMWEEICYNYLSHIVERFGIDVVKKWHIQCYNEPDIPPFFLSDLPDDEKSKNIRLQEYLKLYKSFAKAAERVDGRIRIGEALAGKLDFLEGFLKNIKEENVKLDFVCVHNYGGMPAEFESGEIKFGVFNNIEKHRNFVNVIYKYFDDIEIVTDEWGAAAGGFQNCEDFPVLLFREDNRFSSYYGKMISGFINSGLPLTKLFICLSGQHEMTTNFSGFRNFFTLDFIKKPIYNAFVLGSKLYEDVLSNEALPENVAVIPTKNGENYSVMLSYASENFDKNLPDLNETIEIENISGKYNVRIWCIDEMHTNPYGKTKRDGMEEPFDESEIKSLREEGRIKPLQEYQTECNGVLKVNISCTNNALLLIEAEKCSK